MSNKQYDHSLIEICLVLIAMACMRGCHHIGTIAEHVPVKAYAEKAEQ